jgi:molybdopterin biosynthesis enzyme
MFTDIMISFDQALAKILRHAKPLSRETVRLTDATGRFLAESIIAVEAAPRFDQSNVDGFGVRVAEARSAGHKLLRPVTLCHPLCKRERPSKFSRALLCRAEWKPSS